MENLSAYLTNLPNWVLAAMVVILGWLAAGVLRLVVARLLALFHFNQLCDRAGAGEFLRKGEVAFSPSELAGRGVYWLMLIGVFLEAARLLDIGLATEFWHRVEAALPALLSAVLVFAVSLIATAFLSGFVRTVTRNAGSPYANLWARSTRWVGVVLALAFAFEQAEIRGSFLAGMIQTVFAAMAFAMALAFGLGCKDMARNSMEKLIAEVKERHRDIPKSDMEG